MRCGTPVKSTKLLSGQPVVGHVFRGDERSRAREDCGILGEAYLDQLRRPGRDAGAALIESSRLDPKREIGGGRGKEQHGRHGEPGGPATDGEVGHS